MRMLGYKNSRTGTAIQCKDVAIGSIGKASTDRLMHCSQRPLHMKYAMLCSLHFRQYNEKEKSHEKQRHRTTECA